MKPQEKAIMASGQGFVVIRTEDGNAVSLTTKAAQLVLDNLPAMLDIAKRLEAENVPAPAYYG